ncbi:MAG TPA: PQQ-dependent sugar dehydrogenase [Kofleriaceae bacterium]|nr:PQQ-dependent sugar dehydrogenase [Kofleriaceae bacterium]
MRQLAVWVLVAAACGGNEAKQDAPPGSHDAPGSTVDAPPLPACAPVSGTTISVKPVAQINGEGGALLVTSPPNDGRLFVVMQSGKIMIVENDQVRSAPFLDISNTNLAASSPPGEQGLLGLAFSPSYAQNRQFYVMYTTNNADIVARFYASATDPYTADTNGEIILSIPDFASNHNGGMLEFGKDGYLYIGTGDGGGGGDPHRNGQAIDRTASTCTSSQCEPLLGKILRIDVSTTSGVKNYGIPSDNPYAGGGGEPEIYVIGVRNPWRWSFDRMTGDLWIGDVGQGTYEEVDVLAAGQIAGKNLGWSMYEGNGHCFNNYPCDPTGMTMPQFEKTHAQGWLAVIGGSVYRGSCYPDIVGKYFVADNSHTGLTQLTLDGTGSVSAVDLPAPTGGWPPGVASIHGDARGELYLTTASQNTTANGRIFHIEAGP